MLLILSCLYFSVFYAQKSESPRKLEPSIQIGVEHWTAKWVEFGGGWSTPLPERGIGTQNAPLRYHTLVVKVPRAQTNFWGVQTHHFFFKTFGGGASIGYFEKDAKSVLTATPAIGFNHRGFSFTMGYNFFLTDTKIVELDNFAINLRFTGTFRQLFDKAAWRPIP